MKIYYVYKLINPETNLPFYVGKGKADRAESHLKLKSKTDNPRKDKTILEIYSKNKIPLIEYTYQNLYEDDAYLKEEELIRKYGREGFEDGGILSNITINSRPPSQKGKTKIFTEEHKKNLSLALKGKNKSKPSWIKGLTKETDERVKRLSENRKKTGNNHQVGMKYSQERIEKIKNKLIGRVVPLSQRKKMSFAKKGKTWKDIYGEEKANLMRNTRLKGGDHPNSKKIHTPLGIFETLTLAVKEFNVSDYTIRKRCNSEKDRWKDWYYIN
jgi:hypothetical protein